MALVFTANLEAPDGWAYATPMTRTTTRKLTKSDWLMAGLKAVVDAGPEALKAEPLARRLGTTKGSFYWHFVDVPAFHAELLAAWEMQSNTDIVVALAEESTPTARLRRLAQVIADTTTGPRADPAIRAWSRGSKLAAQAIARVDAKRLASLQDLLSEVDIRNPEMARIIYAAGIGMAGLGQGAPGENTDAMGSLVDLVLALR